MRIGLIATLVAAGLAAVVAVGIALVLHGRGDPLATVATSTDIRFVRSEWLRHPDGPADFTRGEMSRDLVDRVLRVGMTGARVRRLLGAPDFVARREYDYFVGEGARFSGGYVRIRFDAAHRLASVRRFESGGGF